MNMDPEMALWS